MNTMTADPVIVVSTVLKGSREMLTVKQIAGKTVLTELAVTEALRALHRQGQIESWPGRSASMNRYGWLACAPNPVDEVLGAIALDGEAKAPTTVSVKDKYAALCDDLARTLRGCGLPDLASVTADSDLAMAVARMAQALQHKPQAEPAAELMPSAFLIKASKRKPRVMRDADKAQAAALAAARAGARRAEVFALVPVGAAVPATAWVQA